MPIDQASLRNSREFANPNIAFSTEYQEWCAVEKVGLDIWKWVRGEYPLWFRAKVLAYYQLSKQIDLHTADAGITLSRRKK